MASEPKISTLEEAEPYLLIVDDDLSLQQVFKYISLNFDLKCKIFSTAEDAIAEYAKEDSFTHIFLDWRLPGMSGIECAKKLRELQTARNEHQPIIAVTAYATQNDREECVSLGMDDYLSKPFTVGQFLDTVARWSKSPQESRRADADLPGHTAYY